MYPSNKEYNPNDFKLFLKPFIRVFQLFCVSHYSIFHPDLYKNRMKLIKILIYFILFSFLHIASICFVIIYSFDNRNIMNKEYKESPMMYYVKIMSLVIGTITHAVIHFEALFKGKCEKELLSNFFEIHSIFATKLNYTVDYNILRKKCIHQVSNVFILSIVLLGTSWYFYTMGEFLEKSFLVLLAGLAHIILRLRYYQIAVVLTLLKDCLADLDILLKRFQIIQQQQQNSANIRYFRKIYSNAWTIQNLISECYGWSLIAMLTQFTLDSINTSYWIFINLKYYGAQNFTIRKIYKFTCKI